MRILFHWFFCFVGTNVYIIFETLFFYICMQKREYSCFCTNFATEFKNNSVWKLKQIEFW